jgi:hypothetical protein
MDDDTTKRMSPHKKKHTPPPTTKNGQLTGKGVTVLLSRRETPRTRNFVDAKPALC